MDGDTPICFYIAPVTDFLTDREMNEEDKKKHANGPPL
jgi:hypothetical protein